MFNKKIGLMLVSLLLAMSCATDHMVIVDETVPKEESAVVVFSKGIKVRTFNGVDVYKAWYRRGWWTANNAKVSIPAGVAEIGYDIDLTTESGTTYKADKIVLTYTFEAGKEYYFKIGSQGRVWGIFGRNDGIALYDKLPDSFRGTKGLKPIEFWVIKF